MRETCDAKARRPRCFLVSLVGIGCGDRHINRRHCRRRGRYERIRKDLSVTTPTRKLLSGRRLIGGHFDNGARNMASASAAFVDLQSMRPGCRCFHENSSWCRRRSGSRSWCRRRSGSRSWCRRRSGSRSWCRRRSGSRLLCSHRCNSKVPQKKNAFGRALRYYYCKRIRGIKPDRTLTYLRKLAQ